MPLRRAQTDSPFDATFLARLERLVLAGKAISAELRAGSRRAGRLGDGLEFADHRPYAPGDDVRFVDWRYFARRGRLVVRLFHEHSVNESCILLDRSASMAPGGRFEKFDQARRCAAALAYVALAGGEPLSLTAFAEAPGAVHRPPPRRQSIFGVLDFLSSLSAGGGTNLTAAAEAVLQRPRMPGGVVILGDLLGCRDDLPDAIAHLSAAGCRVSLVHVYAPDEAEPQLSGPAEVCDVETGRRLSVEADEALLKAYRQAWRRFADGCREAAVARGARYAAIRADAPIEQVLLRSLPAAGVLVGA
mgnify:CR=1 FL=1